MNIICAFLLFGTLKSGPEIFVPGPLKTLIILFIPRLLQYLSVRPVLALVPEWSG
jgi:hypothetical protein